MEFKSPHPAAASPSGSCPRGGGTEDRPYPTLQVGADGGPCTGLILAGRATIVPFTTDMTGPERTATDNARAASTCAVPCLRRPRARPIWLWEQGVEWVDPQLIGPSS